MRRLGAWVSVSLCLATASDLGAQMRPAPAPTSTRPHCERFLVVVLGIVVNPAGELARFEVDRPTNCRKETVDIRIGAAWKKTACAWFAARNPTPTYAAGEAPQMLYTFYIYDVDRPQMVIVGRQGEGLARGNTVVDVREEILQEGKEGHVCNGNLDAP